MKKQRFKYVRIQGKALAKNTMFAKGVFSMCWQMIQDNVMDEEDTGLYKEIDDWFAENLPWPEPCKRQEPVVCWFKTENSEEMLKMIQPALWLLERYNIPYYLVYTNFPGEIVYEDQYQIAAKTDGYLQIDEVQKSWSPPDEETETNKDKNMDSNVNADASTKTSANTDFTEEKNFK